MRLAASGTVVAWSLLAVLYVGPSPPKSRAHPAGVKVVVERVERVSRDEVHLSVRVVNNSGAPVFVIGIEYAKLGVKNGKAVPYPLHLEQWRESQGWKTVGPCLDVPPPDVIRINPGGTMTEDLVLTIPLRRACKETNLQLNGRLRFRLEYFSSRKRARAYLRQSFSDDWKRARAEAEAVSEPFEIPPPKS